MLSRRNLILASGAVALAGTGLVSARKMGSLEEYNAAVAATRAALLQDPQMQDFIRYATLAANSHNTQPWLFRVGESQIEILPDLTRQLSAVDPDNHHLFCSLGCAAENLMIAAAVRGRTGDIHFNMGNPNSLTFTFGTGVNSDLALFDAIPLRQSTRADFDNRPATVADLRALAQAAKMPGVDLILITDRAAIDRVSELVVAANSVQMADPAFMHELKTWLRFNPRQALTTADGLFSAASGNPSLPTWLGPTAIDWVFRATEENAKYRRQLASSAGVAVFVSAKDDPEHWVAAGRACQRFALQATALVLKHAFVNQPVEVASFRPDLAAVIGIPGRRPDLVMRFGYGPQLPYAARRPVSAVLV